MTWDMDALFQGADVPFWYVILVDHILVVSTVFAIGYLVYMLADEFFPRWKLSRRANLIAGLDPLSLALSFTVVGDLVAVAWNTALFVVFGDGADSFIPLLPVVVWSAGAVAYCAWFLVRYWSVVKWIRRRPVAARDAAFRQALELVRL